ncbi:hypothetical protein SteCoe_21432 [Stentor coeruleus]|uniref:ribonuclease Z n=1 Tax=Stentor coeruleus TaxID=5963 RepID=A0A1R2BPI4_9CILI|nr:hypothetical protein SteCoe_21432 [Stentor coeruleus]
MRYYLQVLSTQSSLSSPSMFMFFDSSSYLFNCGDCTQRIGNEYRIKFHKVKNIFITNLNVNTVSSLPAMILTLQENNHSLKRTIHGPPGFIQYIKGMMPFAWSYEFKFVEYGNIDYESNMFLSTTSRCFTDDNMKVHIIQLDSKSKSKLENSSFDMRQTHGSVYIMECKSFPKKVMKDAVKKLGIQGSMISQLVSGENIEINGKIVTPDDILMDGPPQPVVVVFDLPDTSSCQSLVAKIKSYLKPNYNLAYFAHFTQRDIFMSKEYIEMVNEFPNTSNIVLNVNASFSNSLFRRSDELQNNLNQIHKEIFPKTFYPQNSDINFINDINTNFPKCIFPNFATKFILAPASCQGIDRTHEPIIYNPLKQNEIPIPLLKSKSIDYKSIVDVSKPFSDPQIIFLGTASMKPGKCRNVTGIHISNWGGGLLLDCGEGTYSQLVRVYGEKISEVLLDLKAILITHLHADHHVGILKILYERAKLTSEFITIAAPAGLHNYLKACTSLMAPIKYRFFNPKLVSVPGITIQAVLVDHKVEAYGYVLTNDSGWKIVFSGDTRPCSSLIEAGINATVLIHEATFDSKDTKDAIKKFHSTLGEALQVADDMKVWKVVLTHFSQRYCMIPESNNVDAIYAFDLMKFRLSQCTDLISLMPALIQEWKNVELVENS